MKKWILVGLLFAALGAGLILKKNPGAKSHAPTERAPSVAANAASPPTVVVADDRLALQVAALNSEISSLRAEVGQAAQPPVDPTNEAAAPPQTPEQARQAWRDHMAQVAVEYDMETRDARWARETESKIQGVLSSSRALSDSIEALDCRSASCRVQLKPSQAASFEEDLMRVVHEIGTFLPEARVDAADPAQGKRSTVIYLKTSADNVAL